MGRASQGGFLRTDPWDAVTGVDPTAYRKSPSSFVLFCFLVGFFLLLLCFTTHPRIFFCNIVCISPTRLTSRRVNVRWTNPYQIPMRAISLLTKLIPYKAPVYWLVHRKAIINRLRVINTDLNKMKREPQRRLPNTFLHTSQV